MGFPEKTGDQLEDETHPFQKLRDLLTVHSFQSALATQTDLELPAGVEAKVL